jgi:Trk K+ transport system NAD-binding subunit
MHTTELEDLQLPDRPAHPATTRAWREWCFLRVVGRHFRVRFLLMLLILAVGALLFLVFEPEKNHTPLQALHHTWLLIFGEPPEAFPRHPALQAAFFLLPVLGLVVIIEGIIDFALTLRDRQRNERFWCKTMAADFKDHVVLVGFGKLGYRTYHLLRRLGEAVVVIEQNEDNQFLDDVRRDGSPLLLGDARREALLVDANVAQAKSIILATNNDLANLEIALDARQMNPQIRVVVRMFDQNMADKVRAGFDIHIAMSQSAISAPAFVMAAVEETIVSSHVIGGQLVVLQRWKVHAGGPLCGRSIARIMRDFNVGIVERKPADGERQLIPAPNIRLAAGDELLVQGRYEVLMALRDGLAERTSGVATA